MQSSKGAVIVGWVLSGLVALMLIGVSASAKFLEWEGKEAQFEKLGFSIDLMLKIGIVEVIVALLYLIPRTAFVGAILLTGSLGGATVTHVRVHEQFFTPVVVGIVAWVALGLRRREIFSLALGHRLQRRP